MGKGPYLYAYPSGVRARHCRVKEDGERAELHLDRSCHGWEASVTRQGVGDRMWSFAAEVWGGAAARFRLCYLDRYVHRSRTSSKESYRTRVQESRTACNYLFGSDCLPLRVHSAFTSPRRASQSCPDAPDYLWRLSPSAGRFSRQPSPLVSRVL
jgi:hypothetical protein